MHLLQLQALFLVAKGLNFDQTLWATGHGDRGSLSGTCRSHLRCIILHLLHLSGRLGSNERVNGVVRIYVLLRACE